MASPSSSRSPADAVARGISMVFQELNLFGNLSVAENIFMTREIVSWPRGIDHAEQERRAAEFLNRLQAGIKPGMMVEDLMIGQQQLVEIAKAVSLDARSSSSTSRLRPSASPKSEILFRVIADLKARGVAIVYISHRLEELVRIGDYITVLRDGRVTGHERHGQCRYQMDRAPDDRVGRQGFCQVPPPIRSAKKSSAARTISLPRAHWRPCRRPRLAGGAGRRNPRHLRPDGGGPQRASRMHHRPACPRRRDAFYADGKELRKNDTAARIASGIALIPEDRQRDGLVSILSIASNLTLSSLQRIAGYFHISEAAERSEVRKAIDNLSIKVADPSFEVSSLSGGNQQKVVIGKALMTQPEAASDGRAEPRHRCRRQGRCLPHHAAARRRRSRHHLRHLRPR